MIILRSMETGKLRRFRTAARYCPGRFAQHVRVASVEFLWPLSNGFGTILPLESRMTDYAGYGRPDVRALLPHGPILLSAGCPGPPGKFQRGAGNFEWGVESVQADCLTQSGIHPGGNSFSPAPRSVMGHRVMRHRRMESAKQRIMRPILHLHFRPL